MRRNLRRISRDHKDRTDKGPPKVVPPFLLHVERGRAVRSEKLVLLGHCRRGCTSEIGQYGGKQ